ncbi:hypothetical protein [sulfur-oxidizing endosymbiont of Gigantopelta aegis]|uniref:hypothetical protein n=1 Tax=sulfur-oxidizing endosymbiont of Gigantopelta aegis TaxID=2794934 RepID=UPI0018DD7E01|nr:hypothetical protein [sulfur-oxidizing endosymbiont of Gigantopelta aegis]
MLDEINFKAPIRPWISSYIGDFVNSLENNKYYWIEHINSLSSFEHGIQYILDKGFTRFLEVGSSNTLSEYCQEIIDPHCWLESSLPNYKKNEDRISIDNNSADSKVVALSNGINKDFLISSNYT